jgi:hypothetical protein
VSRGDSGRGPLSRQRPRCILAAPALRCKSRVIDMATITSPLNSRPPPPRPFFTGVHRFGVARFSLFLSDPFHTLLK